MTVRRTLIANLPVSGHASELVERFASDPHLWMPPPASGRGRDRWTVQLRIGPAHRFVLLRLGQPWRIGAAVWRACSWAPQSEEHDVVDATSWLPSFSGTIGAEPGSNGIRLVLHGTYVPPQGRVGALADALLFRRLAHRSAIHLLQEVAAQLTATPKAGTVRRSDDR